MSNAGAARFHGAKALMRRPEQHTWQAVNQDCRLPKSVAPRRTVYAPLEQAHASVSIATCKVILFSCHHVSGSSQSVRPDAVCMRWALGTA